MPPITPMHVTQQDGSACRGANCWAAVGAWLAEAGGRPGIKPARFRKLAGGGSGVANDPGCPSGFITDLSLGLAALGVSSSPTHLTPDEAFAVLSVARPTVFAVEVDYSVWPEPKDCLVQANHEFNHMVGLIAGKEIGKGIRVMNPLCHDYQRVGIMGILKAAMEFADKHRATVAGDPGTFRALRVKRSIV